MAIYDIDGNVISSGDGDSNLLTKVYKQSKVINLLDRTKSTIGRMSGETINPAQTGVEVSDYIRVYAQNTYVCQVNDTTGKLGIDGVFLYSLSKSYIRQDNRGYSTNGTYHWIVYTPQEDGYIRYQYSRQEASPNPMVFMGDALSTTYVAYTGESLDFSDYTNHITSEFRGILQEDYLKNNLFGKTVYWFGDSNSDNWASSDHRYAFTQRYGCKVKSYGTYGAHWGDNTGAGVAATDRLSAIGQYNEFLGDCPISTDTYLFPDDSAFFFMMGTNSANTIGELPAGGVGAITDETCENDVSAMNYILKRMRYYGRKHPLGVFLPWSCGGVKREALIAICNYYCIPYFDIPAIIPDYLKTKGLVRPDGTTVSNDYFTDGGVHLATYGWAKFARIAEPWMAYQAG